MLSLIRQKEKGKRVDVPDAPFAEPVRLAAAQCGKACLTEMDNSRNCFLRLSLRKIQ
jgi:hypothetical protein